MDNYDVLVIGAGPGGYIAAIRCAQLGMKTACVERWLDDSNTPALGGTCLNVGCIPSKALLDSSHHFEFINHQAAGHGITVKQAEIDVATLMKRKEKIVRISTQGIAGLFRKHKIDWFQGQAHLRGERRVVITPLGHHPATETIVSANHIIIATGSVPATLPQATVDNQRIVDSTGALAFTEVPEQLVIIGAGVIGLELGSLWRRLGAKVIMLEALEEFLPAVDAQIAQEAFKALTRQGLDIRLRAKVTATEVASNEVSIYFEQEGTQHKLSVDKLVVAVGRKPNTEGLDVEASGLKLDPRGFIEVDEYCRTHVPNVYAIGDVVRGPMLAHKAMEEGVAVAEYIAGQHTSLNHETIPWVIYTWPEIAWVGKSEQSLKAEGYDCQTGTFPFLASGRARALGETTGLVKIIGDKETDRILGVHIFGPNASELIAEAVVVMEFAGSTEDLARTIHAHPTLSEAIHEAALAVDKRPLHL
jgi:dihydrolipoamide dehydrogenase